MIPLNLVPYIIYRFINAVVIFVEHIVGFVTGWTAKRKVVDSEADQAEIQFPIWRRKGYEGDFARPCDFMLWHLRFVPLSTLVDPHWTVYCATDKEIIFVYTQRTLRDYQARNIPFLYIQQHPDAMLIARVSIKAFIRLADMLGKPKCGTIAYLSNMPRAGTTLATTLLQASEQLICLSEPDVFTSLAVYKELGDYTDSTLQDILRAAFYKHCHEFDTQDVIIIKTQSNGGILVPDISAAMPDLVKHIFLYRETVDNCMKSIERMLRIEGMVQDTIDMVNFNKTFSRWIIGFTEYQSKQFRQIQPSKMVEYSAALYLGPMVWYLEQAKTLEIPLYLVKFEDIIGKTRGTMEGLFKYLGVITDGTSSNEREELLDSSVAAMGSDSQAGSFLSRDLMAKVQFTTLTPELRAQLDDVAISIGGPMMPKRIFTDGIMKI